MRLVLQRVAEASVAVDDRPISSIGRGLLILVGVGRDDAPDEPERLAEKVVNLRIFPDADDKMNRSITDIGGEILVVSQFTLYGDVRRGRRPSWTGAADPDLARDRVETLARAFEARGVQVARGVFGAHMRVALVNDGPVTLVLDAAEL